MAAGNTTNLSTATINSQAAADATYVRAFYDWCTRKVLQYQTAFGATQTAANTTLAAAPYSFATGDAAAITNLIVDLNILAGLLTGTAQTPPRNMLNDCASLMGIN